HRRFVRTDQGWVSAAVIRIAEAQPAPAGIAAGEHCVDVEVRHTTLIAFEGTQPVYATVVSTGRSGHITTRGEFRVWIKLATETMSNADSPQTDNTVTVYSVEHVPWVMFF